MTPIPVNEIIRLPWSRFGYCDLFTVSIRVVGVVSVVTVVIVVIIYFFGCR